MRVRAIRDCVTAEGFHPAGATFDYSGPENRHLVPVVDEPAVPPPAPVTRMPRDEPFKAAEAPSPPPLPEPTPEPQPAPQAKEEAGETPPPAVVGEERGEKRQSGKGWRRKTAKG
jgi:hypothetical protein